MKGDFHVTKGGFRQFHYDSLNATVDYAGAGVTLDAKLQQNPTAWITAKGYVPTAAFALSAALRTVASRSGRRRPIASICTSTAAPIDLGVVQGFTTALTNVTGTVQAKIDVTGAADDPHPTGQITVQHAGVQSRADRRRLQRPRRPGRPAAGPRAHRADQGARQPAEAADDLRRPGDPRAVGRHVQRRTEGGRLQGHRQQDGQRAGQQQPAPDRRAGQPARRGRPRRHDRQHQPRSDPGADGRFRLRDEADRVRGQTTGGAGEARPRSTRYRSTCT